MEQIIIKLKDESKRSFLLELLAQFSFVELQPKSTAQAEDLADQSPHDFLQSAGLFANRDINANQLRKEAWRVGN